MQLAIKYTRLVEYILKYNNDIILLARFSEIFYVRTNNKRGKHPFGL